MHNTIHPTPFYFLRHGQTDWNKEYRLQGQTDIPLNETGILQAQQAAELLANIPFTVIATSPLQRALRTAETVALALNKSIVIIDDLKEACWGILEGTTNPTARIAWTQGQSIAGAEEYNEFLARTIRGVNQALSYPGPVLIVAHGGLYSTLQQILNIPITGTKNCIPIYHEPPQVGIKSWGSYIIEAKHEQNAL